MFILADFLNAFAYVFDTVLELYMFVVIAAAVISWVNADPYNPIVRFLNNATEPLLYRVRRSLPVLVGGIDFSPLVLLLGILFLRQFLVQALYHLAFSVR
jgi:YggT family protein